MEQEEQLQLRGQVKMDPMELLVQQEILGQQDQELHPAQLAELLLQHGQVKMDPMELLALPEIPAQLVHLEPTARMARQAINQS